MTPESPPTSRPPSAPPLRAVDAALLEAALPVLCGDKTEVLLECDVTTSDQAVGAQLAGQLARIGGLHSGASIKLIAKGCVGQGFGFAATGGMCLRLEGYANDTVGSAMSGTAQIVVVAPESRAGDDVPHLAGNTVGYGATGGSLYVAGRTGQRFGVRNSGATMVCEGVGKYAFEYMTGGTGVVLGTCGPCIGSGMTGGTLFLFDEDGKSAEKLHSDVEIVPFDDCEGLLRQLIADFERSTGSRRATAILHDWGQVASKFVAVQSAGKGSLKPLAWKPTVPSLSAAARSNIKEPGAVRQAPEVSLPAALGGAPPALERGISQSRDWRG